MRTIRRVHPPGREDVGELVTRRPQQPLERLNPFLFINHHGPQVYPPGNRGLPFGPHPHRGFETVTFIVEGSLTHRDTEGHESTIGAGGVQWMTAGRGVEHSETSPPEFLERGGPLEILQLWVNLPARLKMADPRYVGLQRDDVPSFDSGGARIHLIAGTWDGNRGPVESLTGVQMMTIDLAENARIMLPAPRDRRVFFYVVRGEVSISGRSVPEFHLAEIEDDGDALEVEAVRESLVIFGHADPLREPIASYGPFVMNTRQEIFDAITDYEAGKFRGKVSI